MVIRKGVSVLLLLVKHERYDCVQRGLCGKCAWYWRMGLEGRVSFYLGRRGLRRQHLHRRIDGHAMGRAELLCCVGTGRCW